MAALLDRELGVRADIEEGAKGEFSVWVGDERVAQKGAGGFPADADVLAAVRQRISGR